MKKIPLTTFKLFFGPFLPPKAPVPEASERGESKILKKYANLYSKIREKMGEIL